jgi:methyltransferase (TIGR00027 family)
MRRSQASGTAIGAAAVRAIESEKPANERICYDPFARRFIDTWVYLLMKLFAWYGERHTRGGLTFIVCRCRYIDDYLQECLKSGVAQLVILGAGLDSRAYRNELHQGVARVFEVDHPATQASKIERVKKVFGKAPSHVTYVPVDFVDETLEKLLTYGLDRSLKTLFIWEGVTPYLNIESVDTTLARVHANSAPGSAIVFDYQEMSGRQAIIRRDFLYAVVSRLSGEKDVFGFEKGQIEDYLTEKGSSRIVDTNADQLTRLYCTGLNRNRKVGRIYSIIHAEVGDQLKPSNEDARDKHWRATRDRRQA